MSRLAALLLTFAFLIVAPNAYASTGDSNHVWSGPATKLVPNLNIDIAMSGAQNQNQQSPYGKIAEDRPSYSLGAIIPMAFLVGFGSAHFYMGAKWRGLRYLAYDLVAVAIDTTLLVLAYYDYLNLIATWVICGVVFAGERIFQTIDAAHTLSQYNRGFDVTDAMAPGRSSADVALNPNDGGMPRGRMKTLVVF